ncbi:MAG: type II toxin-antitoxin system prevent-host-death family antitoxin [Bacteroidota bacterium]
MTAITISSLRNKMREYFDLVMHSHETIIVPRSNGTEDDGVVIISLSEYNALQETAYLNSSENNRRHLMASIEQDRRGEYVTYELDE